MHLLRRYSGLHQIHLIAFADGVQYDGDLLCCGFKKNTIFVTAIAVGYLHMGGFPKLHCLKTDLTILCCVEVY